VARLDPTCAPPRIAFGISRNVGSAPVRNRLRRRLRVVIARAGLPPGDYLFGASAAAAVAPFAELEQMIATLAARCRQAEGRR
jgi:ribonuclease P protein component